MTRQVSKPKGKLDAALKALTKQGLRRPGRTKHEVVPTGLIGFDAGIGGGLVRGRIYEIAGNESTGKTTLALEIAKAFLNRGQAVVYNDYEHALDPAYAEAMGVRVVDLVFEQPDSLEGGMAVGKKLIETGQVGLAIVDSVAAMQTISEGKGSIAPAQVPRALGPILKDYVGLLSRTQTVGLFINQVRTKFAVYGASGIETPGGRALKYLASARMFLTARRSKLFPGGIRTKVSVWKNKTNGGICLPSEVEIVPMRGVVREQELLELAVVAEVVVTDGVGNYVINGHKIKGRERVLAALRTDKGRTWVMGRLDKGGVKG